MKSDLELLLEASLTISRMKREANLNAAAIAALRAELEERDRELAILRRPSAGFMRDQTTPALLRRQAG